MDARWKDGFEEELTCPICLNVFDEPVQLPCSHNFCKSCISKAWAKSLAAVRCPECNRDYEEKPPLEKNYKLANVVKRFDALTTAKVPADLHCLLCRRGPALPVRKVCLRCKEPCCQSHIHTHLKQPCPAPGHLLVDLEELSAWTCPSHEEYRLLHCEDEQVALCPFCCISHCTNKRHKVCDVDTQRIQMQSMLMKQQGRLDHRVHDIDEQLSKLETDKTVIKAAMMDLKERVRAHYKKMQALLEADQAETLQLLDATYNTYKRKSAWQVLQLNESHQEAEKLRRSVQSSLHRADSLSYMRNTKPYEIVMDRSNSYLSGAVVPLRVGHVKSSHLLSSLAAREKTLRKVLEEPLSDPSVLDSVVCHSAAAASSASGSGLHKRNYFLAFPGKTTESSACADPSKRFMAADLSHHAASVFSQNAAVGPAPGRLLDSSSHRMVRLAPHSSHHSGTVYTPAHFPGGSQPTPFEGRKVLVCTLSNCCCSRAHVANAAPPPPPYPPLDSFPAVASQEFPSNAALPAGQTLQHFPSRGLMDEPQLTQHLEFLGLYGPALRDQVLKS